MKAAAKVLIGVLALLALAACGERKQTAGGDTPGRRGDAPSWAGPAGSDFVAPGWKVGDATSWDNQMRARSQGQNEYSRATINP